jgi:hypothetical protein
MASERPIYGDHQKEAEHARQLAAQISDKATADALLRYAAEQERELVQELREPPPRYSGPAIS